MKKILTLRCALLFVSVILAFVVLLISFGAQFVSSTETLKFVMIGEQKILRNGIETVAPVTYINETSIAGLVSIFVGSISALFINIFVKKTYQNWIILGFGVVILVGAILVFFVKQGYAAGYADYCIKIGTASIEDRQTLIDSMMNNLKDYRINFIPYLCAILTVIGSAITMVSTFVEEKPLLK